MANLDLLWAQIDAIITRMEESSPDDTLWIDPDTCPHPCVHGTTLTGPVCCRCGTPAYK